MTSSTLNGTALRVIRERSGLSAPALADELTMLGVACGRRHINKLEAGKVGASPALVKALAEALKVPQAAILANPSVERVSA